MSRQALYRVTLMTLFAAVSGCASVPDAPTALNDSLPESFYIVQPWAQRPPVDIFRRVSAIQSALGGLQQSLNSYSAALNAQAAEHNRRVFLQAELARHEAAAQKRVEPRRSNFKTRGTPEEIDAANRMRAIVPDRKIPTVSGGYQGLSYTQEQAQQLGELFYGSVHGWKEWGRGNSGRANRKFK